MGNWRALDNPEVSDIRPPRKALPSLWRADLLDDLPGSMSLCQDPEASSPEGSSALPSEGMTPHSALCTHRMQISLPMTG